MDLNPSMQACIVSYVFTFPFLRWGLKIFWVFRILATFESSCSCRAASSEANLQERMYLVKMKSTVAEPLIVRLSASSWTISLSAGSTVFHQGDINYVDFFHSWVRHLIFTHPSTICLTSVKYARKTLKPKIYVWILSGGEIYCVSVYCGGEISKADILFGEFCHCLEFFASLICDCALGYLWLCVFSKWRRKTELSSSYHHIAWVNCLLDWNALFVWQSVNQTNWTDCQ